MADSHFRARGMFEDVLVAGEPLKIPAIVPRLGLTPGRTDWAGPEVGSHNGEVFGEILGYTAAQIDRLRKAGVV